jgi:hypothetical protein
MPLIANGGGGVIAAGAEWVIPDYINRSLNFQEIHQPGRCLNPCELWVTNS